MVSSMLIFLIWAWQGIILEDVSTNSSGNITEFEFSFPNSSKIVSRDGSLCTGSKLHNMFRKVSQVMFPRDLVIRTYIRTETWDLQQAKDSAYNMMQVFMSGGFDEVI